MLLQNRDPVQFFPSIVDLKTHSHQDDNYKNFKYKVPLDRKKHHRWVLLGVAKFCSDFIFISGAKTYKSNSQYCV